MVEEPTDQIWELITDYIGTLKKSLPPEKITLHPEISETRLFYKMCGKDPSRYRPSADSLRRRLVKNLGLYKVNNVVDILNYISLKSGISIGGYDRDKIEGDIFFDTGNREDVYTGIGRGPLNIENLPVLRDSAGPFGSPTSDSIRTSIDLRSRHILFVFFCFNPSADISCFVDETKNLLIGHASAEDICITEQYLTT